MNYQHTLVVEPVGYFRAIGRMALRERFGAAFVAGFLYLIVLNLPSDILVNVGGFINDTTTDLYYAYLTGQVEFSALMNKIAPVIIVMSVYSLVVSGALTLGMSILYLRYRRRQEGGTDLIFVGFSNFGRAFMLSLFISIFVFLWSMLFIIPGIIALYRYKLAFFILADNPEIAPLEAIRLSKYLMRGNKAKLFTLNLSFIGWSFLAMFASTLITSPFSVLIGSQSTSGSVFLSIIETAANALAFGYLYMYIGSSEAAFYERAAGLMEPNLPLRLYHDPEA
ncbi:MAG: DUF975 family protein [Clostridiales Family XIII bacterium]|jgi:uncharacterized membrane protein|nr:DUF975 family protein [Clostridiales Family XIII bacterium]